MCFRRAHRLPTDPAETGLSTSYISTVTFLSSQIPTLSLYTPGHPLPIRVLKVGAIAYTAARVREVLYVHDDGAVKVRGRDVNGGGCVDVLGDVIQGGGRGPSEDT